MRALILLLFLLGANWLFASEPTALDALKLLPRERAAKLARIEGRDGAPAPERWYFLVQDPAEADGVHEFVVANDEVVASRALSQFAEKLSATDVIGGAAVKIDSDRLAKMAREFADANQETIAQMNFELKREGTAGPPVWTVSCFDKSGESIGQLNVTAGRGNILSHPGFASAPAPPAEEKKPAKPAATPKPELSEATPLPALTPLPMDDDDRNSPDRRDRSNPVGNTFKNIGRSLRKMVPF